MHGGRRGGAGRRRPSDSVEDLERLFHGIPLDKVSTLDDDQTPTAAILLAMYVTVERTRLFPSAKLQGTLAKHDILKE